MRLGASALAALLAAAAVSVAGLVAFVGLVVPNWVRVVAGPDHRRLLPLAALGGAETLLDVFHVEAELIAAGGRPRFEVIRPADPLRNL